MRVLSGSWFKLRCDTICSLSDMTRHLNVVDAVVPMKKFSPLSGFGDDTCSTVPWRIQGGSVASVSGFTSIDLRRYWFSSKTPLRTSRELTHPAEA